MAIKQKHRKEKLTDRLMIYKLKTGTSYEALAKEMGISKMTLFKRKREHDWSVTEAFFIQQNF